MCLGSVVFPKSYLREHKPNNFFFEGGGKLKSYQKIGLSARGDPTIVRCTNQYGTIPRLFGNVA